jgi:hypothetical protein
MKFRKLRIAFSATCGIACVLLIVLWVRSLKTCDLLSKRHADGWMKTTFSSSHGTLEFEQSRDDVAGRPGWHYIGIDDCGPPTQMFVFKLAAARKFIQIPDCLPLMFCIAGAIGPWLPWRFSLRTLLIATTLVAVVLGLIVWQVRR